MKESPLLKRIMLRCSRGAVRLWRNNCGTLQDRFGAYVKYGVANPGGSDLIGFKTVTITQKMVGTKLAVFVALEVKGQKGRVRKDQKIFIDVVKVRGGIAGVVRSVDEALGVLQL